MAAQVGVKAIVLGPSFMFYSKLMSCCLFIILGTFWVYFVTIYHAHAILGLDIGIYLLYTSSSFILCKKNGNSMVLVFK